MIRSEGLQYAYPGTATLCFPDLRVEQGGCLLLQGPSGSGKSTWLALAAALLSPHAGRLEVAGQVTGALKGVSADAWRARTVGFLPQQLHLSDALDVRGNLALAAWAAGVPLDSSAVAQVLATLQIEPLARRRPFELSGGQAQRVALARAVVLRPQVVLADEPTASLDDVSAEQVLGLLRSTASLAGSTLVVATHDARVAQAWPDALLCRLGSFAGGAAP